MTFGSRSARVAGSAGRAALVCWLLSAGGCASPSTLPEWTESRLLHGVEIRISVRERDPARARAALDAAMAAAERAAALLLAERPGSEIDILQRAPSRLWIEVSETTGAALLEAQRIAEDSGGAFDPTSPPLLTLWGLRGRPVPQAPRDFEIDMMLRRVDWTDLELEFDGAHQARRLTRRTELDLGGLARGAILDAAVRQLRALGVRAGRASALREHAVYGGSAARPWPIELLVRSRVAGGRDEQAGVVALAEGGLAVASRGPVGELPDGTRVHDRLDPRSGRPTETTRWVAVRAAQASTAAGYADAVFALGGEGPSFVAERDALDAVIAFDASDPFVSPGMHFEANE